MGRTRLLPNTITQGIKDHGLVETVTCEKAPEITIKAPKCYGVAITDIFAPEPKEASMGKHGEDSKSTHDSKD